MKSQRTNSPFDLVAVLSDSLNLISKLVVKPKVVIFLILASLSLIVTFTQQGASGDIYHQFINRLVTRWPGLCSYQCYFWLFYYVFWYAPALMLTPAQSRPLLLMVMVAFLSVIPHVAPYEALVHFLAISIYFNSRGPATKFFSIALLVVYYTTSIIISPKVPTYLLFPICNGETLPTPPTPVPVGTTPAPGPNPVTTSPPMIGSSITFAGPVCSSNSDCPTNADCISNEIDANSHCETRCTSHASCVSPLLCYTLVEDNYCLPEFDILSSVRGCQTTVDCPYDITYPSSCAGNNKCVIRCGASTPSNSPCEEGFVCAIGAFPDGIDRTYCQRPGFSSPRANRIMLTSDVTCKSSADCLYISSALNSTCVSTGNKKFCVAKCATTPDCEKIKLGSACEGDVKGMFCKFEGQPLRISSLTT